MGLNMNIQLRRAVTAAALLLAAGAATAQSANVIDLTGSVGTPTVNLTAERMVATLPDGTSAPMWGYCATGWSDGTTAMTLPTTTRTCTSAGATIAAWTPGPTLIVKAGSTAAPATLNIQLTNALPTPTSLVILGQLGGGLGTPMRLASPTHSAQTQSTWFVNAPCKTDGTTACKPFVPPQQADRVMSFGAQVGVNGGSATLSWTNLKPGTYLYETGTHPSIQAPMGLYGVLVVTAEPVLAAAVPPATASTLTAGAAYPGAFPNLGANAQLSVGNTPLLNVGYDAEAVALLSEIDAVQNAAVDAAAAAACTGFAAPGAVGACTGTLNEASYPPAVNYRPTYFLVNGQPFSNANLAGNAIVMNDAANTGNVLVRFVNAGLRTHVPSIVGQSMSLIAEDGNVAPGSPKVQSEVLLPAGKTVDALITPAFVASTYTDAAFPVFDRALGTATGNTPNGGIHGFLVLAANAANAANALKAFTPATLAAITAQLNPSVFAIGAKLTSFSANALAGSVGVSNAAFGTITAGACPATFAGSLSSGPQTCLTSKGQIVTLRPDGSFTVKPAAGAPYVVADSFAFYGNGTPVGQGMQTTVTLNGCGTACDATVAATNLSFPNPTFPNSRFWSVKNAAVLKVLAPGVLADTAPTLPAALANDTPPQLLDSKGRPLQAVLVDTAGNPTTSTWVTLNADGSFTAANCSSAAAPAVPVAAVAATCSFNFIAVNPLGAASGIQTVTIKFPAGSGLPATLVDTATKDAAIPRTVTDYAWVIEEDTTYVTTPGVTPPIVGGVPQASLATSFHKSHMPVLAVGCTGPSSCDDTQSINGGSAAALNPRSLPADVVLDPNKRYYISVLPGDAGNAFISGFNTDPNVDTSCLDSGLCGHSMGGVTIPPLAAGVTAYPTARIQVERNPLPTATLAVYIYEDNAPTNGQNDANENGLGGFNIIINDVAGRSGDPVGQITYDAFNLPLTNALLGTPGCPDLGNKNGNGSHLTGVIYTCPDGIDPATGSQYNLAGMALIKNLMPGRFDVLAKPSAARESNGEVWYQTETLEGTPGQDAFTKAGEPNYFQEFGSPGFHVTIGFVNPAKVAKQASDYLAGLPNPKPGLHHVTGKVTNLHMSRPTEEKMWDSGTYAPLSQTTCLVSLNQGGVNSETGLNLGFQTCKPDGSFDIPNVPGSAVGEQYELFIWDEWLDQIRAFKAVTVKDADVAMMPIPVFPWFTRVEVSMYIDDNQDGIRTSKESGLPSKPINIRFRDGSISNVLQTDSNGRATFSELFPLFNWYVTEADTTRYHLGPVNITVDAGGPVSAADGNTDPLNVGFLNSTYKAVPAGTSTSTNRIDGDGTLYEGLQGFIGQTAKIDWARWQFGKTKATDANGAATTLEALGVEENGGIAGFIAYATTRGFDDPSQYVQNLWTPGVPRVTVNLYYETTNPDGTTALELVDTTLSTSWDDYVNRTGAYAGMPAMQCPGQTPGLGPNQTTFDPAKQDPFVNYTLGATNQFKCYDGFHMWNQVQQAVYDGAYVFPTANYKYAGTFANGTAAGLGNKLLPGSVMPGKYVIEIVPPQGYELFKEEDKNILIGDAWIVQSAPQFGALANIFILPDTAVLSQYANPNNPNQNNPTVNNGDLNRELAFAPCVGAVHRVPDYLSLFPQSGQVAPFAGADKPLCDRKEVIMEPHGAPGALFALFTPTPVASHFTGLILDDAASEVNATSPDFGEKYALPYAPVSLKDIFGNEVSRVYSDQWGTYNGVMYSTWQVNVPNPAGYSPNMMITCMNDPGPIPDPSGKLDTTTGKVRMITDPQYNPNFSNFCYTNPFMPGMTVYLDTPVLPVAAFANGYQAPDVELPVGTPAIKRVDSNAAGAFGPYLPAGTGGTLTIQALGDKVIPNPAYQGPVAALMSASDPNFANFALFNSKTITRHYGFGTFAGGGGGGGGGLSRVQLVNTATGVATTLTTGTANWTDAQIVATVSAGLAAGNYHLEIRDRNGRTTVDSAIVTIGGPAPLLVTKRSGFAGSYSTIQSAIDAAAPGSLILVDADTYNELVVMWKPVQLQGVGAESVIINAAKYPTQKLQNWRPTINNLFGIDFAVDATGNTLVDKPQVDALPTQEIIGGVVLLEPSVLSTEEGAGITVLAKNGPSRRPINDDPGQVTPFADCSYLTAVNPPLTAYSDYPVKGGRAHLLAESNFNCAPSRIDGVSVTGGDAGGGIYVNGWAHGLEIADNRVYGNAGALNGGIRIGIPFLEALPNPPANGYQYDRDVHIHHNAITRNGTVEGTPGAGTAANVTGAGGGLTLATGSDNYRVDHNWIAGNFGSGDGGGLGHIGLSRNGSISNNTIIFNQSFQQTAASHGGGIVVEGEAGANGVALGTGSLTIDSNLIQGNFAETGHGGGIRLAQVNGQDVLDNPGRSSRWYSVSVSNNMIVNNVAGWAGGGISMVDTLNSSIVNNTIASNDTVGIAGVILQTNGGTVTGRASPAGIATEPTGDALRAAITAAIPGALAPTITLPAAQIPLTAVEQGLVLADIGNGVVYANPPASQAALQARYPGHTGAWYTAFRTQYAAAVAAYQSVPQLRANAQISSPVLYNNILWQNRSFYFSSAVAQAGAGATVAPGLYASNTNGANGQGSGTNTLASQTTAGQCVTGAAYWDLGVVGDASATPGAVALNPVNSTLSPGTTGYTGANLSTANPGLVHQYCNGSRAYPDMQFEPGAGLLEPFGLQPSMTLDEAGNFVNLSFGPLSLGDPTKTSETALFGDYHVTSAIDGGVGTFGGVTAPNHDFDGQPRPSGTRWDSGADQFVATTGTCLVYDPTNLSFASALNVRTGAQMVTVYNTCVGATTVPAIGLAGGGASQFAQTNDCNVPLSTGGSCSISVTFLPTTGTPATKTAAITAGGAGNNVVALTGVVVVPTYTVTPLTSNTALGRFNFGSSPIHVPVLSSSPSFTAPGFLITNTSTNGATLVINSLPITGANANQYSVASTTCPVGLATGLAPQATCTVTVRFLPTTIGGGGGVKNATMTVTVAAGGNTPVFLTGTAIAGVGVIAPSPSPLPFGPVTAVTTLPITVTNNSTVGGLVIGGTALLNPPGNPGGRFSVVNTAAFPSTCLTTPRPVVAPGGSCTIQVRYTPGGAPTATNRSVTLQIAGDGAPASVNVVVTATGR
jgi:large repetitive protein